MTTYATVADAYQALASIDFANLPVPLSVRLDHASGDYQRWEASVHVSRPKFDDWLVGMGLATFEVRPRSDEQVELFIVSETSVVVFCIAEADEANSEVSA